MLSWLLSRPAGRPLRLLCLGAHSDDIEIGCGGTVLTLLRRHERVAVRWVVFAAHDVRAREAQMSATAFLEGASERAIDIRQYRDGYFPFVGAQIKDDFEAIKLDYTPDLVLTHSRDDRHQDHRLIAELTWNTFRNHMILEYEIPKYDGDLGQPNFFVPLEPAECSEKMRIILDCFPSQRSRHWFDEETFRALMRLRGMEANAPSKYAEAFYCRKMVMS